MMLKRLFLILLGSLLVAGCSTGDLVGKPSLPAVILEFRYHQPQAGEVFLVWGVNGWAPVPEDLRAPGTRLIDNIMNTPMEREGESFVARVNVPAWSMVEYGFLVTRLADGSKVEPQWEGSDDFRKQVMERNDQIEITSRLDLQSIQPIIETEEPAPAASEPVVETLVDWEIRYTPTEAVEVIFVWGIDGWSPLPAEIHPAGTSLVENVMQTPMTNSDGTFSLKIQVPRGAVLDYGFLVATTRQGQVVQVRDWGSGDGYHTAVNGPGASNIDARIAPGPGRPLQNLALIAFYLLVGIVVVVLVGFLFRSR